jgi:membrane-bound lytic murein transglycosylase F
MNRNTLIYPVLFLALIGQTFFPACREKDRLDTILESGKITVITRNNANCYYIYREKPMGFEYDLAKEFAGYLGVELEVLNPSWEGLVDALNSGEGDFIAASWTITPSRMKKVNFSIPYLSIRQQVLLHKNNNEIKSLDDLRGKTVHLRRGTSYEKKVKELNKQGFAINIEYYADTPTEELIRMVSEKEIRITIADSNIAMLNRRYYPDVKIAFPLEDLQSIGWAVKKGEDALRKKINSFFKKIREDGTFDKIYNKYYAHTDFFDYLDLKKFHRRIETRLPVYRDIIEKAAQHYNFDWRLIAAMVYQESHFNPRAVSYTGVKGIMQLTANTATDLGVDDLFDPEQSIMGGVRYLRRLYEGFEDVPDPDRLYVSLASYNVGRGHVIDAQQIAKDKQLNSHSWEVLEGILPLLRRSKYYKKTKYGYCRGTEPVRYVKRIMIYYDILKNEAIS